MDKQEIFTAPFYKLEKQNGFLLFGPITAVNDAGVFIQTSKGTIFVNFAEIKQIAPTIEKRKHGDDR